MSNSFISKFAANLLISVLKKKASFLAGSWFFGGPFGVAIAFALEKGIDFLIKQGLLHLDLSAYASKVEVQKEEYKKVADKAFKKAEKKCRKKSEEEKEKLRNEYLSALRDFGAIDK